MSGIEIAGLVLGAFPMALMALVKYRAISETLGFWWEIRLKYQKCTQEVKFHRLCFSRNLKQLVLPLVADQVLINQLLADPGGVNWQESTIAQQLKDRLRDSYDLYLDLIQQLKTTMDELNKVLGTDKASFQQELSHTSGASSIYNSADSKLAHTSKKAVIKCKYELRRIKFSLEEVYRKELFQELKECNEKLEKLLATSDTLSQLEAKAKAAQNCSSSVVNSAVISFWNNADRLYKTLATAWNCSCAGDHIAKIMLQHRTTANVEFILLLSHGIKGSKAESSTWPPHETKIKVLDMPASQVSPTTTNPVYTSAAPVPNTLIAGNVSVTLTPAAATHALQNRQLNISAISTGSNKIQSLCQAFATYEAPNTCYGFLEDEFQRYYVYPSTTEPCLTLDNPVTLDGLLRRECQQSLNRRQRYCLALIIASSFLQLRKSPWLPSAWSKSEISFFRDADDTNVILLNRPYIERTFSATNTTKNQPESVSAIALLGIVLLELCFGTLIDDHPIRQKFPPGDERERQVFDQAAAMTWLQDVGDEAGPDYAGAAEWCLVKSKTVPSGAAWRQLLFENVVQPLERCAQYLNPLP